MYRYVSVEEFEKLIESDQLLEYVNICGNYYGTPNEFIKETTNNGDNVIAVLEIKGAINAKKIFSNAITIFIMPPSFDELERRLRGRKSEDDNIIKVIQYLLDNDKVTIDKNKMLKWNI